MPRMTLGSKEVLDGVRRRPGILDAMEIDRAVDRVGDTDTSALPEAPNRELSPPSPTLRGSGIWRADEVAVARDGGDVRGGIDMTDSILRDEPGFGTLRGMGMLPGLDCRLLMLKAGEVMVNGGSNDPTIQRVVLVKLGATDTGEVDSR